jgi:hypothetical protein
MVKIINITIHGIPLLVGFFEVQYLRKAPLHAMIMEVHLYFPMHPILNGQFLNRSTTITLAL